ncbi:MAG: hypothetical protein FI694_06010 [SAR202 cluster bacterium]|nr:hypothetical protein [SAR202 cluster bacterium]MQG52695.1 hypothetical protein [SAR202 cluster bacterium]|tara:strand:+ start:9323 stop:9694 length:372 start_codon:yes stop_codon:yes gene_type:complete
MDTDYKNIGTIEITQDLLTEYIGAVGANSESFRDIVPNMLVVSRSIAMMLDTFNIKDGAIHSTQEVQNLGTAKVGDVVACYALKEKTKTMKDMEIISVHCKFQTHGDNIICESRSVVMVRENG